MAGSHTVAVKDVNGCVYTTSVTIIDNPGPTAIATTIVNANCGVSNGSITITGVTGGTAPYTYSFNVAAGAGPYNATTSFTGLAAGSYNLEVKDANGCLFIQNSYHFDNPGPTAIATTIVNANCGASNGSITSQELQAEQHHILIHLMLPLVQDHIMQLLVLLV